jgi:hypothetical protein
MPRVSGVLMCLCRQCNSEYDPYKSRADYQGYCSQGCMKRKLKWLGWTKGTSMYKTLRDADAIGSWPVVCERIMTALAARPSVKHQKFLFNVNKARLSGVTIPEDPNITRRWMRFGTEGYRECEENVADILRLEVPLP